MSGPENLERTRGHLFDSVAEIYDDVRPHYPTTIYDALAELVQPPADVLEIGAGSGQATVDLAQRGYRVIAIEPGRPHGSPAKEKASWIARLPSLGRALRGLA